jgi:hypothetical protein
MERVVARPMVACPSSSLRALWVVGMAFADGGAAGASGVSGALLFFQTVVADGFVKCVGEHAEAFSDFGHFESFIEQSLSLGEEFGGELVPLTWRSRSEKGSGSFQAEFFASPFHGDKRNAEGSGDLALRCAAVGNELAGK